MITGGKTLKPFVLQNQYILTVFKSILDVYLGIPIERAVSSYPLSRSFSHFIMNLQATISTSMVIKPDTEDLDYNVFIQVQDSEIKTQLVNRIRENKQLLNHIKVT